jgi:uncharacterized membrane protein YbhN (UPF0104 family)
LLGRVDQRILIAILAVQPLVALNTWMGAIRLSWLVGTPRIPVWQSAKAIVLSSGLNLVLPSRLGELAKATYLHEHAAVPVSVGLSAVVIERSLDLVVLGLIALAGIAILAFQASWALLLAALAVAGAMALLPLYGRILLTIAAILPWRPLRDFVTSSIQHALARFRERTVLKAFALGVVMWAGSVFNVSLFFVIAGGNPLDVAGGILVFLATTVGGAIPVLPGGFGTYEAGAVMVLKGYGYSFEEALVMGVALHASQVLIGALGAAVVFVNEHVGITAMLRRMRRVYAEGKGSVD